MKRKWMAEKGQNELVYHMNRENGGNIANYMF